MAYGYRWWRYIDPRVDNNMQERDENKKYIDA
jgi:hypothetical protein